MNESSDNPNSYASVKGSESRGAVIDAIGDGAGSGNFTMNDTMGVIFLGLAAMLLVIVNMILVFHLQRNNKRIFKAMQEMLELNRQGAAQAK